MGTFLSCLSMPRHRMFRWAVVIAVSLLMRAASGQVPAAPPSPQPATKPADEDALDRLTPYGSVRGFLFSANRGNYSRAGEYLDILATPSRKQELARQLEVVLDFGLSGNLDHLPRTPEGDRQDGLSDTREHVGYIETARGKIDILLDRVQRSNEPSIWLFSSETLKSIPGAFEEIGSPPVAKLLPRRLQEARFLSVPLWRWLMIGFGFTLAFALASLVARGSIPVLRPLIHRMTGEEDDQRLLSLKAPIRVVLFAVAIRIISALSVSLLARQFWTRIAGIVAIFGFAWLAIQFSNIVSDLSSRRLLRKQAPGKLTVVALARRLFKIIVVLVAAILLLRDVGVNVTAMLAGLGVGGIALALAAQKTLENLFGGISIIMREAVRVGDFCKIADQVGTVEDIGLGSTRLRTLGRTVVSVPNAQISQMNLENISMRDKFWFHHVLGLRRDASPEQIRYVLTEIEKLLHNHPKVEVQTARIRFIEFGRSSLDLEIFAYIQEKAHETFLSTQQELLLRVMDIVAASGTNIASPSQTIYLERGQGPHSGESAAARGAASHTA